MSIARTTEITSSSEKSFEDAIKKGIKRYAETIDKVEGAWDKELIPDPNKIYPGQKIKIPRD